MITAIKIEDTVIYKEDALQWIIDHLDDGVHVVAEHDYKWTTDFYVGEVPKTEEEQAESIEVPIEPIKAVEEPARAEESKPLDFDM